MEDTGDEKRRQRAADGIWKIGQQRHMQGTAIVQGFRRGREGDSGVPGLRRQGRERQVVNEAQERRQWEVSVAVLCREPSIFTGRPRSNNVYQVQA